jgi:hypothetical protein
LGPGFQLADSGPCKIKKRKISTRAELGFENARRPLPNLQCDDYDNAMPSSATEMNQLFTRLCYAKNRQTAT